MIELRWKMYQGFDKQYLEMRRLNSFIDAGDPQRFRPPPGCIIFRILERLCIVSRHVSCLRHLRSTRHLTVQYLNRHALREVNNFTLCRTMLLCLGVLLHNSLEYINA